MKRGAASLLAVLAASCAHATSPTPLIPPPPPPNDVSPEEPTGVLVASLRYGEADPGAPISTLDAPFRAAPPPLDREPLAEPVRAQSFALANGLQVEVVERHGFPVIAARLVVVASSEFSSDVGEHQAYLLASTFLRPLERVRQTRGFCNALACDVVTRGSSSELGAMLDRIADLAIGAEATRNDYERRFAAAERAYKGGGNALSRNGRAAMFGAEHHYGSPAPDAPPSLGAVELLRNRVFVPSHATLILVGDVGVDEVQVEVRRRLALWSARAAPRATTAVPPLPPPPDGSRAFVTRNRSLAQVLASIVARGPSVREPDYPAFVVLAHLLGGHMDSAVVHQVREGLAAAYAVGADVETFPDASVVRVTGSYERPDATAAIRKVLDIIAETRKSPPSDDDLERAKRSLMAEWRHKVATDDGLAEQLGAGVSLGLGPAGLQRQAVQVTAISPEQVQAAASRYLNPQRLRLVVVGRPDVSFDSKALGFGDPILTDDFARPMPSATAAASVKASGQ